MDIRHKLNSYIPLMREIKYLENKIEAIRDRQTSIRSSSDVSEVQAPGSNSDKIGTTVAELIDLEDMLEDKIKASHKARREIEGMISMLPPTEKKIIELKYIGCESFERICKEIGYSYRQTIRLHNKAIVAIS